MKALRLGLRASMRSIDGLHDLDRRELAAPDARGHVRCGHVRELICERHPVQLPLGWVVCARRSWAAGAWRRQAPLRDQQAIAEVGLVAARADRRCARPRCRRRRRARAAPARLGQRPAGSSREARDVGAHGLLEIRRAGASTTRTGSRRCSRARSGRATISAPPSASATVASGGKRASSCTAICGR